MLRKFSIIFALVLVSGLLLASCGPQEEDSNILRFAYYAPTNMDPAFLATVPDDHIARQWSDFLVFFDEENEPDPSRSIAKDWNVDDSGTEWTFEIREGVKFHDDKEMTSRDVKFTFDRLRDPEVGAATVGLYSNIVDITTPDEYTVVFQLENPNPDFLKDLYDYHALIMDADNEDFSTNFNGTGPFIVENYIPEDRIVFKRNPNYWLYDDEGNQLPFLDGMEFIFLGEPSAQVEALRGGQVDYLIYLPTEHVSLLEQDPNINVYQRPSNTSYVIRMRSDRGPASDVRVRQALKLATDRAAILEYAIGGLGTVGRDTPIGPSFGDLYLDVPEFERDVERAKELLAEAGYPDGFELDIQTQESSPVPAIATIWKEQLADIGVTVNIRLVPSSVYYGADDMWLEADFGITDWGGRPYPQPYLDLAYVSTAQWNETHWNNAELDRLAALAAKEMDHEKRVEYYHQIQEIFHEEGTVIIPFFINNLWAARDHVKGIRPTRTAGTALDLRYVYLEK